MRTFRRVGLVSLALFCLALGAATSAASPPGLVNYQGVLRDASGAPLAGSYDMAFRFFDASGSGTLLLTDTHNSAAPSGQVAVSGGLFSAQLGAGTIAAGSEPSLAEMFRDNATVYLEIQVGTETLSPRVRVVATAYAQNAKSLDGNDANAFATADHTQDASTITSGTLPPARGGTGLDTSATPAGSLLTTSGSGTWSTLGAGAPNQILQSTGGALGWVTPGPTTTSDGDWTVSGSDMYSAVSGNVGIGTSSLTDKLTLKGSQTILGESDPVALGAISANLSQPVDVCVSGGYAYVASQANNRLCVFDVSNPSNIVAQGYTSTNLSAPEWVFVSGRYAYVISYSNSRLCIFDVSDPSTIVAKGYTSTNLSGTQSVFVSGRYAYVVSQGNNRLCIFDVSDPSNIVAKGYTSTNLSTPFSVFVSGPYAYVASFANSSLCIFDVSNPSSIVAKGTTTTNLSNPTDVVVSGPYAYVASSGNDRLCIFNVSNPASIAARGYVSTYLDAPFKVRVAGRYAYVGAVNSAALCVFDVADPSAPVAKGRTSVGQVYGLAVSGRTALVASPSSNTLSAFDLDHLESPTASIGSLRAGNLGVSDSATINNSLYVQGGLSVGPGGALIGGDLAAQGNIRSASGGYVFPDGTVQTTAASPAGTTGWTISGSDEYSSVSGNVGIGTTSPGQKLSVTGTIESTSGGVKFPDGTVQATAASPAGTTGWTISGGDEYSSVSGNVGIGTTSPGQKLSVAGNVDIGGAHGSYHTVRLGGGNSSGYLFGNYVSQGDGIHMSYNFYNDPSTNASVIPNSAGGTCRITAAYGQIRLATGGANTVPSDRVWVTSGGSVGIGASPGYQLQLSADSAAKPNGGSWTNPSDLRLKKNIRPFADGLNVVRRINPVRYQYNGLAGMPRDLQCIGVVAQEARDAAPYTVGTFRAKLDDRAESETELYDFNASALTFVMINAIKELDARTKGLASAAEDAAGINAKKVSRDSLPNGDSAVKAAKPKDEGGREGPETGARTAPAIFPVCESVGVGDVLVNDSAHAGFFCLAKLEADRGVVGISIGEAAGSEGQIAREESVSQLSSVPVATGGIVYCKADATFGPILANDLLVTSPTPGHAMKMTVFLPGTVLGKAMEPLESGTGMIKVLVMLR